MATVTLRYWAAAKEAAGVASETITARTLADALAAALHRAAGQGRDAQLRAVLARSSFLVDGTSVGAHPPERVSLTEAAVVEILPPFAGG